MINFLKKLFHREPIKKYNLIDVYGCPERPPQDCPTFLYRDVHRQFENALKSSNIIVVYGESRQGKTWTIEKYCPHQIRIGCDATMSIESIKNEMLDRVDMPVMSVEHVLTESHKYEDAVSTSVGTKMLIKAGSDFSDSSSFTESLKTSYLTVDTKKKSEFFQIIQEKSAGKHFVFDNFHYLPVKTQQEFCSVLKEFNYWGIKIIIVGVWKDAAKITALAPDLQNRCQHIDIGSWTESELDSVLNKGERALNVSVDEEAKELFKKCAANNIGIFKDFLQKYCQEFEVYETLEKHRLLKDDFIMNKAAETVISEAYTPLRDRIINLALPQRKKRDLKYMRQKIVIAVLQIIVEKESEITQTGIDYDEIQNGVDDLCSSLGLEHIGKGNLTQELGVIHQREENRQTNRNYISLFYFDKANKKLLILEPALYEIKAYNQVMLDNIIDDLKQSLMNT